MLCMGIERFRNRDAKAVYLRAQEQGRMLPEGLTYLGSWVEDTFDRCFQLMECEDPRLFQQWTVHWEDLVAFEIVHVVSSTQARDACAGYLGYPFKNQEVNKFYRKPLPHLLMHKL